MWYGEKYICVIFFPAKWVKGGGFSSRQRKKEEQQKVLLFNLPYKTEAITAKHFPHPLVDGIWSK